MAERRSTRGMWVSNRRLRAFGIAVAASVLLIACIFGLVAAATAQRPTTLRTPTLRTPALTPDSRPAATPTPSQLAGNDWTQYRYDVEGTGDNPEDLISDLSAPKLTARWIDGVIFGGHAFGSTPAVYQGTVYLTNGDSLFALDLRTGTYLWQFDVTHPTAPPFITSSVAIDSRTAIAYFGTNDARVFAVNLQTHQRVWQVTLGDVNQGADIWSSPLLVNGLVYIGLSSGNDHPCVRGAAFALDPASGRTIWVHHMVSTSHLGGGVWSSITADPAESEVLVTTGNPCDEPADTPVQGGTSNADQNAILALNWNTGATLWRFTAVSNDFDQDLDFGAGAVSFTDNGQQYVVAGNKQGVVYAIHPPAAAGRAPHLAWSQTVSVSGAFPAGGIYTPPTYHNGVIYEAGGPTPDGSCQQGALFALKAATGAVLWKQCTAGQVASPPSLTGDVLFVGEHLSVVAYAAATGKVLWRGAVNGDVWGGVTVSHGEVLLGTVTGASRVYCFALPIPPEGVRKQR